MSQPILQKDTSRWWKIFSGVEISFYRGSIVFGYPKTTLTIIGTATAIIFGRTRRSAPYAITITGTGTIMGTGMMTVKSMFS